MLDSSGDSSLFAVFTWHTCKVAVSLACISMTIICRTTLIHLSTSLFTFSGLLNGYFSISVDTLPNKELIVNKERLSLARSGSREMVRICAFAAHLDAPLSLLDAFT